MIFSLADRYLPFTHKARLHFYYISFYPLIFVFFFFVRFLFSFFFLLFFVSRFFFYSIFILFLSIFIPSIFFLSFSFSLNDEARSVRFNETFVHYPGRTFDLRLIIDTRVT